MTAVHESAIALEFLYATLNSDASLISATTGGVWRSLAPPTTMPPYIIISYLSSADVLTAQAVRLMNNSLYQVKVVGPATLMASLVSIASEFDTLLKRTSAQQTDGFILSCYREYPLQIDELVNGELWTNIGGTYRMLIQQTS